MDLSKRYSLRTFVTENPSEPFDVQTYLTDTKNTFECMTHLLSQISSTFDGALEADSSRVASIIQNEYVSKGIKAKIQDLQEKVAYLRIRLDKEELKIEKDRRIRSLEDGLKTFRDEALRLKNLEDSHKIKIKHLIQKSDFMQDDIDFLKTQVKETIQKK